MRCNVHLRDCSFVFPFSGARAILSPRRPPAPDMKRLLPLFFLLAALSAQGAQTKWIYRNPSTGGGTLVDDSDENHVLKNVRLTDMKVSPDGKHAIGVENLNSVALVDFSAGRIVYRVSTGDSQVWELNFAPDGSRFVGNYLDHITVWNTADGSEVFTYKGSTGKDDCIATACFWKDPDTILVLDREHLFRISVPSGEKTLIYTIGEHQEWYDPNDNILVTLTGNPPSASNTSSTPSYSSYSRFQVTSPTCPVCSRPAQR